MNECCFMEEGNKSNYYYKKKLELSLNVTETDNSTKHKSTPCECQRSAVGCLIEEKESKSKTGHNSARNAFSIVPLDSIDYPLESEHILRVSSKYLQ